MGVGPQLCCSGPRARYPLTLTPVTELREDRIRPLVRRALERALGVGPAGRPLAGRPVVDIAALMDVPEGGRFELPPNAIVTPLARDHARERRITLVEAPAPSLVPTPALTGTGGGRSVALGADHGGYALKEQLKGYLQELGWQVQDVGPFSAESVDYPDYAYAVARLVGEGRCEVGIMIDGVGIGSCMVANKVPGVRAAMCYDLSTARNSREHNHANLLTLGGQLIGPLLARQIVKTWLETPYGSDRHARRVAKIGEIEARYLK